MKKKTFLRATVVAFAIVGVVLMGCASTGKTAEQSANLPEWLNILPPEDALWGIGMAKNSTEDLSMTMAEARARQSIARQLSTLAKGMISDYARDAGTSGSTVGLQLAETVSRQLAEANLAGARAIKRWKAPDGAWWYLVEYRIADAKLFITAATEAIYNTEEALYADFKTRDALQRMDEAFDAADRTPEVVSN